MRNRGSFIIYLIILMICISFFSSVHVSAGILSDLEFVPGLRFWGGDLEIDYKGITLVPSLTTRLCVLFGSGYETIGYYREPDESQYTPPDDASEENLALFNRWQYVWALGIRQGILFHKAKNDNLLETYLYYRGKSDTYMQDDVYPDALIFDSGYPDAKGILLNSFITGLFFNSVVVHPTQRKRTGIKIDLSYEYAPGFINDSEKADFSRLTFDARGFLTLIDTDPENKNEKNIFNLYIGNRFLTDCLFGEQIPVVARQAVGGRGLDTSSAFGGVMRGIATRRFDGYLKVLHNFDIRMNLPTLWIATPGIVLYFDAGLSDELDYKLSFDSLHTSTGIGLFVFGLGFDVIVYANYWIDGNKFSPSFDFKLHF
jgi:hypothetical protein